MDNPTPAEVAAPVLPLTITVPRSMVARASSDPQAEMMLNMAIGAMTDEGPDEQKFFDAMKVIMSTIDKPGKWELSFNGSLMVQLTVTP